LGSSQAPRHSITGIESADLHAVRVADNETTFRGVNEAIEAGRGLTDASRPTPYVCECARLGCTDLIELLPPEYQAVRRHPRRFIVSPGHDLPDVERVVERCSRFLVVEKIGAAGVLAAEDASGD
jgi:hypothetical protein